MKRASYEHLPRRLEINYPSSLDDTALEQLASRVFYRGSEDHKGMDNVFGFSPTPPRRDASVCDTGITRELAQQWLRQSIRKGNIQWTVPSERHPRYVFGRFDGTLYIARLTNDGKGEYKGNPVQEPITIKGLRP